MKEKDGQPSFAGTVIYTIPIHPPFLGDKMSIYDPHYLTREEAIDTAMALGMPESSVQRFDIDEIIENIKRNEERYHLDEGGKLPPVPREVADIRLKMKRRHGREF